MYLKYLSIFYQRIIFNEKNTIKILACSLFYLFYQYEAPYSLKTPLLQFATIDKI